MLSDEIHKYPGLFRNYRKGPTTTTTTELTKINIIAVTLSEYTQNAVDITLVILGASLNLSIIFVVALNSSLRISTSCYVISLVASNLIIMIEPSRRILRSIFELNIPMNLDYVFHVSFYSAVLTIVILSIENYIGACERHSSIHEYFAKLSNTSKRIVFIWLISIMITAMELHLYDHFERDDMHDIFAASTIMFVVLPFLILVLIHCAIIYELLLAKSIEGQWRSRDLDNFRLSIGLVWAFFLTMVPYRIAKVITSLNPNAKWCCSTQQMENVYLLIKIFPIISTIVCYLTYKKFRKAIQNTISSLCSKNLSHPI